MAFSTINGCIYWILMSNFERPMQLSKSFAYATLLARIVSTRFSSFSRHAHAFCGMNPTFHARIPMMPNKILEVKCTNKGCLTCSICCAWAWSSSHSNFGFFFILLIILFSFHFCLACGLLKIRAFFLNDFVTLVP